MVRRFLSLFLCVAILACGTLSAYAVPLFSYIIKDGNTHVGIFKVAHFSEDYLTEWKSFFSSDRVIIAYDGNDSYYFLTVPSSGSIAIEEDGTPADLFNIRYTGSGLCSYFKFDKSYDNATDTNIYTLDTAGTLSPNTTLNRLYGLVIGTYFNTVGETLPTLSYNYLAEYEGQFVIVDDISDEGGGNWWDGILGWLSDFWQTLIDTLKGLFVPSGDYFQNFFNEIKADFDKKLGGISDFINSITGAFSSLKNFDGDSRLVLRFPDNQFFQGYDGISVDVLAPVSSMIGFVRGIFNAILIIFTTIICYRRLIVAIRG